MRGFPSSASLQVDGRGLNAHLGLFWSIWVAHVTTLLGTTSSQRSQHPFARATFGSRVKIHASTRNGKDFGGAGRAEPKYSAMAIRKHLLLAVDIAMSRAMARYLASSTSLR
jgi:hypothetical protein